MEKAVKDDLEIILEELLERYSDAEAEGDTHMVLRSARGAGFHRRIARCYSAITGIDVHVPEPA